MRQDEAVEVTQGGIILPAVGQERPMRGVIVAIGPGKTDSYGDLALPPVKAGDNVYFSKFGGVRVTLGDYNEGRSEELILLRVGELLLADMVD